MSEVKVNGKAKSGSWLWLRVAATAIALILGPLFVFSTASEELNWLDVAIVFGGFCLLLPIALLLYLWLQSKTYGFCRVGKPSCHNSPLDPHYPLDSLHFFALLILAAGMGGGSLTLIYGLTVLPYSCFIAAPGAAMWLSVWLVYAIKSQAGAKTE